MSHIYRLTPDETVVVKRHTAGELHVEVTYGKGQPPLAHFHPEQDESFEVLDGVIGARIDGVEREYRPGQRIEIPRGAVHQMWNAGEGDARATWTTSPAGRTLDWFAALDHAQRSGNVGKNGMPGPLSIAVLLTEYRDVMRIAARPRPLVSAALRLLAVIGRVRGRQASVSGASAAA